MPWIESHTTLARHPKTLRLARRLGLSVPCVLGHLHLLWWWAIEYAQDGDLSPFAAQEIALACLWDGEPQAFLDALQAAGFLDAAGIIHDWHQYAGKLIDRREANAERMRRARADTPTTNRNARAEHVQDTCGARVGLPNQPTVPTTTPNGVDADATASGAHPAPIAALQEPEPAVRAVPKPKREKPPSHEAVRLYRRATDVNPKEGVRQQIEEAVDAEDADALRRWQQVLQEWLSRGYSSKNVAGLLDWYREGIPHRKRPSTVGGTAPAERGYVPNPGPPPVDWDDAKAAASDAERERTRQELVAGGVLSGRRAPPSVNGTAKPPPPDPAAAEERLREKERKLLADGVLTAEQVATARRARQPAHAAAGAHA